MKNMEIENAKNKLELDVITDFNSKDLRKSVLSPYLIYNGYLDEMMEIATNPKMDDLTKSTFKACAGSVFSENVLFRLRATLQSYSDYISSLTNNKISNIALYEYLEGPIKLAFDLVNDQKLIQIGAINQGNLFNFVFTISSVVYNETIDFLYRYGIQLNESVYNFVSVANIKFNESLSNDLLILISDYNNFYKPYENIFEDK